MPRSPRKGPARAGPAAPVAPNAHGCLIAAVEGDPPALNRVSASEVYALLGFNSVQAMNHARRMLQRSLDPTTGGVRRYPDFGADYPDDTPEETRAREVAFERTATLVLPLWGGIKYPQSAWTYDLARCRALNRDGVEALTTRPR